jgi:hypothetical protein
MLSLVQVDVALESCSWLDRKWLCLPSIQFELRTLGHDWHPWKCVLLIFSALTICVLLLQLLVDPSHSLALGSFWFRIVPFLRWFLLLSRDRFLVKFIIGRRFDSLLFPTSCGSFFFDPAFCSLATQNDSPFLVLVHWFTSLNSISFSVRSLIVDCAFAFDSLPLVLRFRPSSVQYCWALLVLLAWSKGKRPANHLWTVQEVKVLVTRWLAD